MIGLMPLVEEKEKACFPSAFYCRRTERQDGQLKTLKEAFNRSDSTFILDFPASRTMKNKYMFFKLSVYSIYVIVARTD
jgi:hypothetical protein